MELMKSRGLAAADLGGQIRELVGAAAHGRTDRPIHHVHIDPPPDCRNPAAVMERFLHLYELESGLTEAHRCGVCHRKEGRDHWHLVWSLVGSDGRVTDLRHDHAMREKISRLVEYECALPWTKGKHNRAVAQALQREGRADVAAAMEAAGLLDGSRPIAASTPWERAQTERTRSRSRKFETVYSRRGARQTMAPHSPLHSGLSAYASRRATVVLSSSTVPGRPTG